ncbi:MAG: hypothetical protein QM597_03075 [Aeromicrobium sp.]|uniref:hypothetical protein n=1 Tax=Aeromicrobium sp. TaxID=1871063 RepID=UPI0039E4DE3E
MTRWRIGGNPSTVLMVLGALGVIAGLVMAFVVPAVSDDGWSKDAKAAEAVANQFLETCYEVDPADPDATKKALDPLVTESFTATCLDLLAPTDEEKNALGSAQLVFGNVVVNSAATTQLDGDSANVLVAFSFTATTAQSASIAPLAARGIVHLSKTDGTWRVNDFSEIQQVEATIQDATQQGGSAQ